MSARIGTEDVDLFAEPWPGSLLREVTGIEPEPSGQHVRFDVRTRIRSTQRLALADVGGEIVVGLWPAELKPQAEYLYDAGRAAAMIATASERSWSVTANPHLAFRNSAATRRLYLNPSVDADEYARRWEGPDRRRIGQFSRDEVRRTLWPWLKERAYASSADDEVFDAFMAILGRRPAYLRPGLRLQAHWDVEAVRRLPERELAVAIRRDINAILGAAGEPPLPASP
jgi:hypothetical protein